MSNTRFEVIFRGDVVPGQSLLDVKQRLSELFGAPSAKVDQMFSGRPVVIKRDLDEEAAERYRTALKDAGALVELRSVDPDREIANSTASADEKPSSAADPADAKNGKDSSLGRQTSDPKSDPKNSTAGETIGVAPVGADVLSSEYRRDFTPREVDTSYMTVDEPGVDVLKEDEKSPLVKRDVDTSHLSVKDPE